MFCERPKYFDSDDVKFSYALGGFEEQLRSVRQTLTLFSKSSFATCSEELPLSGKEKVQELVELHNSLQANIRGMKEFPGFSQYVLQHQFQKQNRNILL